MSKIDFFFLSIAGKDWNFEEAMAEIGCIVHAYDPYVVSPNTSESKLHFYEIGNRAVVRYQILDGHSVNKGIETGGAQLHKSYNIGWAHARVPTLQIRP